MQKTSPETFEDVFSAELEEIAKRQKKQSERDASPATQVDRKELAGLALSGGGIRSATTSLGVLQALKKMGLLGAFDYLSTVSGGGFTGGWWSAWTSREFDATATTEEKFFPPDEKTQPERDAVQRDALRATPDASSAPRFIDPVHHLRLFSNYLTPIKGFLSADTWQANAVISRNLVLTWLVLLPMLCAAVLLAQSYFTLAPNAQTEYLYPYSHLAEDDLIISHIEKGLTATIALDSVVDRKTGVHNMLPLQHLGFGGKHSYGEADVDQDVHPLRHLRKRLLKLKTLSADAGESLDDTTIFRTMDIYVDRIAAGLELWANTDSVLDTNMSMESGNRASNVSKNQARLTIANAYQSMLDPDVDSLRATLTTLESRMIQHRGSVRDSWLFNPTHRLYMAKRVVWASFLPVMMIAWIVMLICLWMINSSGRIVGGNIIQGTYAFITGLVAYNGLNWLVPQVVGAPDPSSWTLTSVTLLELGWSVVALLLLNLLLWDDAHWFWKANRRHVTSDVRQKLQKLVESRRARIVTYHQRILLGAFIVSILLCFGGFGHEAINYLLFYRPSGSWDLWQNVARLAGILTIISALTGTGLAAKLAASQPERGEEKPSRAKSLLLALTPPLILVLLLCGVSWCTHWFLQDLAFRGSQSIHYHRYQYVSLQFAMWMLGFLALYYAVFDLKLRRKQHKDPEMPGLFSKALLLAILFFQIVIMAIAIVSPSNAVPLQLYFLALPIVMWGVIIWKYWSEQSLRHSSDAAAQINEPGASFFAVASHLRLRKILFGGASTLLILGFSFIALILVVSFVEIAQLPIDHLFLAALEASVGLFIVDLIWGIRAPEPGKRGNHESRLLLGITVTLYTIFLVIPAVNVTPQLQLLRFLEILITVAIGLVIFVGWRIDPNALSIHAYYKQRIVRAYLGASNWLREGRNASAIHAEDDVPLVKLLNCDQGAPYHIINTTLNLLGSANLETAQRHASNFIFSKRHCGSVTTGYRPTEEYMAGQVTLGTAVAISGAAASPNMGSNEVSGATTMLMSLLNVRLGYWAANPGKLRWKESQPKLWPYYLLKESLSQTTGFGAFCYLTDGGHFDNTGLYPLIERACRYIVLCDNGADPEAHFKDLGNALRRCRIDFGVEFDLDDLKNMTSMGAKGSRAHWLRGTVRYCEEHVRMLWGEDWANGLSPDEKEKALEGTLLILKPSLLGDEPADVLQYGLAYADFPQQSTADQWFSEDQFESYRRLGYWSAQAAFSNTDYSESSRFEKLNAIQERPKEKADLAHGLT